MSNPGIHYAPGCPICRCRSFAHVDEQQADGRFAPGPLMRCVECKAVFKIPAKLRADGPSGDAVSAGKDALDEPNLAEPNPTDPEGLTP